MISAYRRNNDNKDPDYFKNVLDIDVYLATRAVAIDKENHRISAQRLKTGEYSTFSYDKLVIATGSTPKIPNLDGIHLTGVFNLTQLEEANAIRNYIQNGMRKALVPAPDHANYSPGSEEIMVKLVAEKASGRLLGA